VAAGMVENMERIHIRCYGCFVAFGVSRLISHSGGGREAWRRSGRKNMEPAHAGCYGHLGHLVASGVSRIYYFSGLGARMGRGNFIGIIEPAHAGCYGEGYGGR